MKDPLRIRIRSDWDTALTYDSLHEEPENRPVFVGRENVIAPLVAEIIEPNKRGTYLISGYRGTGKTSLIIEALSRAKTQLAAKKFRLFPVVLNVSEVSASLGQVSSDAPIQLDIDPRRLLIALIRQIREGMKRLPDMDEPLKQLAEAVNYAHEKATASKFALSQASGQETTNTRSSEWALAIDDTNVLKTLAVVTGAAAVAFEAAALTGMSWLHTAALGLAGIFTITLTASIKRSREKKSTNSRQMSFEYDNSLQQLETDLKDILASLKQNKLRTVVVMEELDKIDDPKGQQLAAVIRYFKNLFTQAPALFFFVTDKSYFDIISSAIKRARRSRSYAVEHTFFTHRIFVGRPTTDESLEFIEAIAEESNAKGDIRAVTNTLGKPSRMDDIDHLGRFIRLVLFNAANHLFDLKNELRRFARSEEVHVDGTTTRVSSFLIDEQTLPPEEAASAVFQDLIVEKTRSFEIKGGRTYANEVLADSLYAVFNELGSSQPQKIDSFLPITNSDSAEALLLDEQLDLNEAARVREAVHSLIDDLERGRALQSRDTTANTFTWRDDAARAFRYVRQLQKHEESLIAEMERYGTLVNALTDPSVQHPLSKEFEVRARNLRRATEPLTADAAAAQQREVLDRYAAAVSDSFNARLNSLADYGFVFEEVARGVGGSLHLVKPKSGDPRLRTTGPRGGVLLAFGETETLAADVWSFITPTTPSLAPLDRAALVQVVHTGDNVAQEIQNRHEWWGQYFKARGANTLQIAVDVIPLVKAKDESLTEIERIAASLASFGAWSRPEKRPYEPIPHNVPPLKDALEKGKTYSILHIASPVQGPLRPFEERDLLERDGAVVMSLSVTVAL
ncbi:MAG TPA: P-loop NTPase fold protein [Pyrinomonadaceae bacterium]|nr:P-loop NTPase fold protein [Pyrinomonadaceae bacterium]